MIAKPGLDGHDRGAKVIARALRDAGMEVIYTGLRQTPEQDCRCRAAGGRRRHRPVDPERRAHAHLPAVDGAAARERASTTSRCVVGGIIPDVDIPKLKAMGIAGIFLPGTPMQMIIDFINQNVQPRRRGGAERRWPLTLLLADGSVTVQRVIELTFAHEDIRVIAVSDGGRRSRLSTTSSPDIVLADVGMPEVDGYAWRHTCKRAPVEEMSRCCCWPAPSSRLTRSGPRDRVRRRAGEAVRATAVDQDACRNSDRERGRAEPWPADMPRPRPSRAAGPTAVPLRGASRACRADAGSPAAAFQHQRQRDVLDDR